jgi:hypothetical protein
MSTRDEICRLVFEEGLSKAEATRLRSTDPIYQQLERYILAEAERTDTRPRDTWRVARETTHRVIRGRVA